MKKIIVVDFHILQVFHAPYCLNSNMLTDLKSYIDTPDYSVFIYITQPLKKRKHMLKKLRQEKIIGSFLEKNAYILDFSGKKIARVVKGHIRELEEKSREIDELIAIGLPNSQRFAWLQKMGASLVDWRSETEQSLMTVLNRQLVLDDRPTNMKSALDENKNAVYPTHLALDTSLRCKRDMFTPSHSSINPPPKEVFCKQILTELHVLKGLIEEDNPFPEYISLRKFHYGHLIFDGIHFFLEFISVVCIFFHLCHSVRLESHLKDWFDVLKCQVDEWLEKFGKIGDRQESNLLAPSSDPREELTSDEVNLDAATAPKDATQTEFSENPLFENPALAAASCHTVLPVEENSLNEPTERNRLPDTEKLLDKHACESEQPLLFSESFQQTKVGVNKKNRKEVDVPEIETTNLDGGAVPRKLGKIKNKMSLFSFPITASSSKSSVSSVDSRLSVKSSPVFYSSIGFAACPQSEGKATSLESFADLNKASSKKSKRFDIQKRNSQAIGMTDITTVDERSVLLSKESTQIDYYEADTDQLTNQRESEVDTLFKANTAANQKAGSDAPAMACVQCTPGRGLHRPVKTATKYILGSRTQ